MTSTSYDGYMADVVAKKLRGPKMRPLSPKKFQSASDCPGFQFDSIFGFQGKCGICGFNKIDHPHDPLAKLRLQKKRRDAERKRLSLADRFSRRSNGSAHSTSLEMERKKMEQEAEEEGMLSKVMNSASSFASSLLSKVSGAGDAPLETVSEEQEEEDESDHVDEPEIVLTMPKRASKRESTVRSSIRSSSSKRESVRSTSSKRESVARSSIRSSSSKRESAKRESIARSSVRSSSSKRESAKRESLARSSIRSTSSKRESAKRESVARSSVRSSSSKRESAKRESLARSSIRSTGSKRESAKRASTRSSRRSSKRQSGLPAVIEEEEEEKEEEEETSSRRSRRVSTRSSGRSWTRASISSERDAIIEEENEDADEKEEEEEEEAEVERPVSKRASLVERLSKRLSRSSKRSSKRSSTRSERRSVAALGEDTLAVIAEEHAEEESDDEGVADESKRTDAESETSVDLSWYAAQEAYRNEEQSDTESVESEAMDNHDMVGKECRALYHKNETFYPATIVAYTGNDTFTVKFTKGQTVQKGTDKIDIQLTEDIDGADEVVYGNAEPKSGSIWEAAKNGDIVSLEHFIKAGVDVDQTDHMSGKTPLVLACQAGEVNVAKRLLMSGAEDHEGEAFMTGDEETRKMLCEFGFGKANMNAKFKVDSGGAPVGLVQRKHLSADAVSRSVAMSTDDTPERRGHSWPQTAAEASDAASTTSSGSGIRKLLCITGRRS